MHLLLVRVHIGVRIERLQTERTAVQYDPGVNGGHVLLQRDRFAKCLRTVGTGEFRLLAAMLPPVVSLQCPLVWRNMPADGTLGFRSPVLVHVPAPTLAVL